jgi:hypothetical protein
MNSSRNDLLPTAGAKNEFVFLRCVLLLVWIAALNLWLRHHLGFGWDNPGVISGVVASAGTVLFILEKAGNKRPEAWWANLFRWLDLPLLCLLYVVIAVPMLLFSSVAITNGTPDIVTATLTLAESAAGTTAPSVQGAPHGGQFKDSGQQILFKWVPTSPFGETYLLTVDGYLPQTIKVFPLAGVTITPQRDLLPSLSVLFRPDADGLRTLGDGGRLIVWSEAAGKQTEVATSTPGAVSSIMVGIDESISPTLVENWRLELTAKSLSSDMIAKRVQQWKTPDHPKTSMPLQPGMVLRAELQTHNGIVMAYTQLTLGSEKLTDVMLDSTEP